MLDDTTVVSSNELRTSGQKALQQQGTKDVKRMTNSLRYCWWGVTLMVVTIVVALVVGLSVGLTKRRGRRSSDGQAPTFQMVVPTDMERLQFKRDVFSSMELNLADKVEQGEAQPLVSFATSDMLFFNWEIDPNMVDELEIKLALDTLGMKLAPVVISNGETPKYYLTLNSYMVSIAGLEGIRAEWSTYVTVDNDAVNRTTSRFLVIEALSSAETFDPVDIQVAGTDVYQEYNSGKIHTIVNHTGTNFEATTNVGNATLVYPDPSWARANDYIYWMTGVADKAYYNGELLSSPMLNIDLLSITDMETAFIHETQWSEFVGGKNSTPANVLFFENPINFFLLPWTNVKDPKLNITDIFRGRLQSTIKNIYPGLLRRHANELKNGVEGIQPVVVSNIDAGSTMINFEITDINGFESQMQLPEGFGLSPIALVEGDDASYLVSVHIFKSQSFNSGPIHAKFFTYIQSTNSDITNFGRIFQYQFHIETSGTSFDVVDLDRRAIPEIFVATKNGDAMSIVLQSTNLSLSVDATRDPSLPNTIRLSKQWQLSHDRVYSTIGVFDQTFYDSLLSTENVTAYDEASSEVDLVSRWASYVSLRPLHILSLNNPLTTVIQPFFNLEERVIDATNVGNADIVVEDPAGNGDLDESPTIEMAPENITEVCSDLNTPERFDACVEMCWMARCCDGASDGCFNEFTAECFSYTPCLALNQVP